MQDERNGFYYITETYKEASLVESRDVIEYPFVSRVSAAMTT